MFKTRLLVYSVFVTCSNVFSTSRTSLTLTLPNSTVHAYIMLLLNSSKVSLIRLFKPKLSYCQCNVFQIEAVDFVALHNYFQTLYLILNDKLQQHNC